MKLLLEVEVVPLPGWRLLNAAEAELHRGMYITDAPEDHFLAPDDEEYSTQIFEERYVADDLGGWVRDGCDHDREGNVRIGSIIHYGNIGSV